MESIINPILTIQWITLLWNNYPVKNIHIIERYRTRSKMERSRKHSAFFSQKTDIHFFGTHSHLHPHLGLSAGKYKSSNVPPFLALILTCHALKQSILDQEWRWIRMKAFHNLENGEESVLFFLKMMLYCRECVH
jgi:hypothetical protein